MISSCHTTSKRTVTTFSCASVLALLSACASPAGQSGGKPRMAEGSISYPFIADTKPVGRAQAKQPFIIKSSVGSSEYSIEIPDNDSHYDIQIPLAELAPKGAGDGFARTSADGKPLNPANTDKELVAALPALAKNKPNETAMMDTAFGVGSPEGPVQSPSYSMGIARVNQYFKERNYELALVELNNLLAFYPNSPKLLKMKGTLLVKTGNRDLAMKSWQRAFDLAPQDVALQRSISRLNERIAQEQNARATNATQDAKSTSQTIQPTPDQALDAVAH